MDCAREAQRRGPQWRLTEAVIREAIAVTRVSHFSRGRGPKRDKQMIARALTR
jgi:hypothetical protein